MSIGCGQIRVIKKRLMTGLALLFLCVPAFAVETNLGTEDISYFPLFGRSDNQSDEFSGFARELFDEFSARSNVDINYVPLPVNRLFKSLLVDKSIDLKFPDNPKWRSIYHSKSRLPLIYSDPIIQDIGGVMVKAENIDSEIFKLEILGTIRGFTPVPFVEKIARNEIQLIEFSNTSELLLAVNKGIIDGAFINIDVAKHQTSLLFKGKAPIRFAKKLPFIQNHYYLSTIHGKDIIDQFNAFMKFNDRLIKSLLSKYNITKI